MTEVKINYTIKANGNIELEPLEWEKITNHISNLTDDLVKAAEINEECIAFLTKLNKQSGRALIIISVISLLVGLSSVLIK